jgi:hypothetical protein
VTTCWSPIEPGLRLWSFFLPWVSGSFQLFRHPSLFQDFGFTISGSARTSPFRTRILQSPCCAFKQRADLFMFSPSDSRFRIAPGYIRPSISLLNSVPGIRPAALPFLGRNRRPARGRVHCLGPDNRSGTASTIARIARSG